MAKLNRWHLPIIKPTGFPRTTAMARNPIDWCRSFQSITSYAHQHIAHLVVWPHSATINVDFADASSSVLPMHIQKGAEAAWLTAVLFGFGRLRCAATTTVNGLSTTWCCPSVINVGSSCATTTWPRSVHNITTVKPDMTSPATPGYQTRYAI